MQVRPAAGACREGFGHEAREQTVSGRDTFDQALEDDGLIHRCQRAGAVLQRDLVLARRVLRHQRAHRQVLRLSRIEYCSEQRRELIEPGHSVGIDAVAFIQARGRAGANGHPVPVDLPQQIEFQFAGQPLR